MGLLSFFRRKALSASPEVLEALSAGQMNPYPAIAGSTLALERINTAYVQAQASSYAYMYRTQPAVRTVVDLLARNVSQLGLKLYERKSDTDRAEDGDHPAAESLRLPNPQTPGEQFVYNLVADFCIYENAYALKFRAGDRVALVSVPPYAVGILGSSRFTVDGYRVWRADGTYFDVPAEDMFHWRGYSPDDPRVGLSKLETLRLVLAEDAASAQANVELMKSGLTQPGYIERPLEAPNWSDEARERFEEDWANKAKNSGKKHPVLEEGMEFKPASVTPKEAQMLESRKLTLSTVAGVYGVPNGLVGLDTTALREEERRQFYSDVLPPLTETLAAFLDLQILQEEYDEPSYYFEFNLDEKLQGDDRIRALVSAAGAPILTRNEARAKLNLPAADDGDELVTPLNVTEGGKPSPREMPIQDPNGPSQDGDERKAQTKAQLIQRRASMERRRDGYAKELAEMLAKFFGRQERSLKSRQMDAKAVSDERWVRELSADLLKILKSSVEREGTIAARRLAGDFDPALVENYLRASAAAKAGSLNQATVDALKDGDPADVFDFAKNFRAPEAGVTIATFLTSVAHNEAAKQSPDAPLRRKVWINLTGSERHGPLNGESVPLYTSFSNGLEYPGDPSGDAGDNANCTCSLEVI